MNPEKIDLSAPVPVLLVGVDFGVPHFDDELEELGLLAQTAGLQPVARLTCKRKVPDAALFIGSGKADEIRLLAQNRLNHVTPIRNRGYRQLVALQKRANQFG